MEAQNNYDTSWSSATNWSIASGSLVNSVSFESSSSPIIADPDKNSIDSTPKSPLVLCPPSPDSSPCEIKITFTQKHEVRQVYVLSTARVYEIYYAPELQIGNEYLCTVRCGIATRDEEVLQAINGEEAILEPLKDASKEPDGKKSNNESNLNTSEDDWVEVKGLDTSLLDNGNGSLSSNFNLNPERSTRDLYEATAEITDANPCMSITLRLLSLQNKSCVCVDEVYVFADPVDSTDSESQVSQMENSAGSSLMAMLVPTILQLSKATGASHVQDKHTFDTREKEKSQEIGSKAASSTNALNKVKLEGKSILAYQQAVKSQEAVGDVAKPAQLEIPPQVSDTEIKPDSSCNHIEGVLTQLVSRVSRIEDLFLRFEEHMLKPISSIDARLQRVEQQLEELNKKSQNPGLPSCTRISAPEFSCHESDHNSFYNNGSDYLNSGSVKSEENDFSSSVPPDDMSDLLNSTKSLPGLVVTAPEFSSSSAPDDDEEENHAFEAVTDSPKDKPKHALSIDDALASALTGFLSSTSIEPRKYTQALAVKAPDFSNEEDDNSDIKSSPKVQCEITSDGTECISNPVSTSSNISSFEREGKVMGSDYDDHSDRTAEGVDDQCQHNKGGEGDSQGTGVDHTNDPARQVVSSSNSYQMMENTENGEVCDVRSKILDLDEADILNQFLGNQTDAGADTTQEEAVLNSECTTATEVKEEGSDILQNVLQFSRASSLVDFETPILDVKFNSQENSNTKSPLEALLADTTILNVGTLCAKENDDGSQIGEQCNLISVDDWEGPATGSHFSVDVDYYNSSFIPLNKECDNLQEHYIRGNHEMSAASLI